MQSSPQPNYRAFSNGPIVPDDIRQSAIEPEADGSIRRKGSFSFLRRSKSRERSASGSSQLARKLSKRDRTKAREKEMMQEQIPQRPPRVPLVPQAPDLPTFGGEDVDRRPDTVAIMSNRAEGSFQQRLAQKSSQEAVGSDMYRGMPIPPVPPIPPIPGHASTRAPSTDYYAGVESMANRGRYSYASSAISTINSPRKVRRRKDPTPYNILVLGSKGCGKTSFLNFLRDSLTMPPTVRRHTNPDDDFDEPIAKNAFPNFISDFVETDVLGERIGVTLWDSDGLEANVVDLQLKEIANFVESKFENTYAEESKVARTPGFRDTHIHCAFLLLDPVRLDAHITAQNKENTINGMKAKANSFVKSRPEPSAGGLDGNLDLGILRALKGKTTVVPVIAKADTVSTAYMAHLKRAVWHSLKQHGLETLEGLEQEDEEDGSDTSREEDLRPPVKQRGDENHRLAAPQRLDEEDKFSVTSHLESSSDSGSSEFDAANFDLAKPGKAAASHTVDSFSSDPSPNRLGRVEPSPDPHLLPMSIISPDQYEPKIIGRRFPWGFADPYNKEHCDFVKLKDMVFREWRGDLREASRELWYEGWRTSRLNKKARRNGTISLGLNEVGARSWAER